MSNTIFSISKQCVVILICVLGCFSSIRAEEKVIAVVRDGNSEFFDGVITNFRKELSVLAEGKYTFRIKDEFNAEGKDAEYLKQLNRALSDEEVDLIYTAGIVVSHYAAKLNPKERIKPIVAGAIEFSNLANKFITESGTSDINNYTFIMAPLRIQSDLGAFKQLADAKSIHALVDEKVVKVLGDDVKKEIANLDQKIGVSLTIIPAQPKASTILASLPKNVVNVYLTLLPHMTQVERHLLIKGLAERGIRTFSMIGISDVEAGAFATLSAGNGQAFFRRTAINIHQLLSGIGTDLLPVVLNSYDKMTINLAVAKQLGWSPDYDTTLSAHFMNSEVYQKSAGNLTLSLAMKMASKLNPDVIAARAAQRAATFRANSLKTNFSPRIDLGGNVGVRGVNDRINPLTTPYHAESGSLGIEVSQLLYSDRIYSQIKSQIQLAEAAKYDNESARLDVIQSAGESYLDVLNAEALWKIEKENLILSENSLRLAKLRRDIGAAEASEVFRWQANVAQAKSLLLQRDAIRKTARLQLNTDLAVNRTSHWSLADITLGNHEFYFMDEEIRPIVRDLSGLGVFTSFIQSLAKHRSPEIKSFDYTLRSQGILLTERARRYLRPEINISAGLSQIIQGADSVRRDSQTEWTVGIGFTMPLWEGGLRKTEMNEIEALIDQLNAHRQKAIFLIEQRALGAVYAMSASHPSMRLSRQAREFSEKNYEVVRAKYSQGAVSIVEILDAQEQLLSLKKSEVTSIYEYTKDIIAVQRAMSWYEYEKTAAQKKEWTQWLKNYFKTGSIYVKPVSR